MFKKTVLLSSMIGLANVSPVMANIQFDTQMSDLETRYVNQGDKETLEQDLTIRLAVDANGLFEVVGIIGTGDSFSNSFNQMKEFDSDEDEFETTLNLRNLYLQKGIELNSAIANDVTVQVGALETDSGISASTGLDEDGWVDGARVKLNTSYGKITITGGHLGKIDEASAIDRMEDLDVNYIEIKAKREVIQNLVAEIGYERLEDESGDAKHYVRGSAKYSAQIASGAMVDVIGSVLAEVDSQDIVASIGAETDLIELLAGKSMQDVKLKASAEYVHRDNTTDSRMSNFSDEQYIAAESSVNIGLKLEYRDRFELRAGKAFNLDDDSEVSDRWEVSGNVKF